MARDVEFRIEGTIVHTTCNKAQFIHWTALNESYKELFGAIMEAQTRRVSYEALDTAKKLCAQLKKAFIDRVFEANSTVTVEAGRDLMHEALDHISLINQLLKED